MIKHLINAADAFFLAFGIAAIVLAGCLKSNAESTGDRDRERGSWDVFIVGLLSLVVFVTVFGFLR